MGLSKPPAPPPVRPPVAPPRPPVNEVTAPVALASVAPSGLVLPGVAWSSPPALATAPPKPCRTPFKPAVSPGSVLPAPATVPPRLESSPATGAPRLVVAPTCCVRLVTTPATGATFMSSAAPTPPSVGCRPKGNTLSTALPVLDKAGCSTGLAGPSNKPPVTPPRP
ncbi:hypothetical protein D3C72_1448560 [compost metagenome]